VSPEVDAATSFDAVSDLYDRYRPAYPDSLYTDLVSLSGIRGNARVLEIGGGTGIATVPLARRGFSISCLEPGARLAAISRRKLAEFPDVNVIEETFESWRGEPNGFDLVVAAQSFHWTDPTTRFQRAADTLRPQGWLAVFGHVSSAANPEIRSALDAAYTRHAPTIASPSPMSWYALDGPIPGLFAESGVFEAVVVRGHPWSRTYPTSAYLGLLRTMSEHHLLPETQREGLLTGIAHVLDTRGGGEIEIHYDSNLFMARRAP
jgi:SAM-dependent methyltransferase